MTADTRGSDSSQSTRLFAANHGQLGLNCPGWSVAAAAVAGSSHLRGELPCQDAFHVRETADGFVAVLCDGAGSASRSDIGAAVTASAVCEHLAGDDLNDLDKASLLRVASDAIRTRANADRCDAHEYACTLLAVKVQADMAATYHLGDGVIIAGRCGRPELLSRPDRGEYANTTVFIDSDNAMQSLRVTTHSLDRETRTIMLTTDGMQASLLQSRTGRVSQVSEQMAAWLENQTAESAAGQLRQALDRYFVPLTHDDCSVIVARRQIQPGEHLPPTCPACARWLIAGDPQKRGHVRFTCGNCSTEYDFIKQRGKQPLLELVSTSSHGLARLSPSSVALLCGTAEGTTVNSLRFSPIGPSVSPLQWSPLSTDSIKDQLASRYATWAARPVDNPLALILGSIAIRGAKSAGCFDVAVGITHTGHREVLGFKQRGQDAGPRAFLESLRSRGVSAPLMVAFADDSGARADTEDLWPAAMTGATPAGLERLTSTTSVRTVAKHASDAVKTQTKASSAGLHFDSISLVVLIFASVYDLNAQWVSGPRYIALDKLMRTFPKG